MKRVHSSAGLLIALFTGFHLLNHLCSLAGTEAHLAVMEVLRKGYRNLFAESLLLLAVLVQVISGITLFLRKRKTAMTGWEKLQAWSGLYLAFFFSAHVSAVLGGRYVFHLDTNFYFGAAGINAFPLMCFFVPYYGLAMLALFTHVAAVHRTRMLRSVLGYSPDTQAKLIIGLGVVVLLAVFTGMTQYFQGIDLPPAYGVMVGK